MSRSRLLPVLLLALGLGVGACSQDAPPEDTDQAGMGGTRPDAPGAATEDSALEVLEGVGEAPMLDSAGMRADTNAPRSPAR